MALKYFLIQEFPDGKKVRKRYATKKNAMKDLQYFESNIYQEYVGKCIMHGPYSLDKRIWTDEELDYGQEELDKILYQRIAKKTHANKKTICD